MRIRYFTTLQYPSTFANRTQVIKMSEAFSGVSDFILYVDDIQLALPELFYFYGVRKQFEIKTMKFVAKKARALRAALAYKKVVEESSEDTVFYVREGLLAFYLLLVSRRFRNNFFYEMHSFTRHKRITYRIVCYFARGVISTSESKAEVLRGIFKVSGERILVAPNVLDPADFENIIPRDDARKALSILNTKPVVVFTGKPESLRGIDLILKLAVRIGEKIDIICVGGTQEEINVLRSRNGFDKIKFVSFVSHKDAVMYMFAADILIAPQSGRPEFEEVSKYSSPMKVLEYMATGVPSIFSRIPAIEKIVPIGKDFFADPDSPEDWEGKINYILEHYSEMQEKAVFLRKHAIGGTWDARAKSIIDFMDRCACR